MNGPSGKMMKGGGLLAAMAGAKKRPGSSMSDTGEDDAPESSRKIDDEVDAMSFDSAFDDFWDAVIEQDKEGARTALKAAVQSCMDEGY